MRSEPIDFCVSPAEFLARLTISARGELPQFLLSQWEGHQPPPNMLTKKSVIEVQIVFQEPLHIAQYGQQGG